MWIEVNIQIDNSKIEVNELIKHSTKIYKIKIWIKIRSI